MQIRTATAAAGAMLIALGGLTALPSEASDAPGTPEKGYSNCTELNRDFRHGVSDRRMSERQWIRKGATAKGKYKPNLYRQVSSSMDRDHDHIACEK